MTLSFGLSLLTGIIKHVIIEINAGLISACVYKFLLTINPATNQNIIDPKIEFPVLVVLTMHHFHFLQRLQGSQYGRWISKGIPCDEFGWLPLSRCLNFLRHYYVGGMIALLRDHKNIHAPHIPWLEMDFFVFS